MAETRKANPSPLESTYIGCRRAPAKWSNSNRRAGGTLCATLFAILLLVAPRGAFALTWDFDDGSTWGWTARASNFYYLYTPLHSEVVDGVWRIALVPGQSPMVQLISPVIGEDSALFDRLTLRLRLIHHSPIEGFFWMHWSNVKWTIA